MMPARIGWATPWNRSSAIAQSAGEVAAELVRRGHHLTVLRTETGPWWNLPAREAPGAIGHLSDYGDAALRQDFDVVVGHVGDNYGFHGALLPRFAGVPILGVFHDACIVHLMRDWLDDDQERLRAVVRATYGGTPAAEAPFEWSDLAYAARTHPMIEWVASRTIGAVAHAHHYADRLGSACPGPTAVIPLAFHTPGLPPPPTPWDKMTVAVVGHANPNKRVDQIVLAVSASPILRDRCRIRVIGEASPNACAELTAYATRLGVSPPEFTGWVTDDELRRRLRDVDVLSCLRDPVLEGASASLVLALTSGRPTLVSDHGCYAEVPDDAVLKCAPGREALDVMLHLEHLVRDPAFGAATGARGRAFAAPRHTASAYADALEPLLEACIRARPMRDARESLTGTLAGFGLGRSDPAMARVEAMLASMTRGAECAMEPA